MKFGTMMHLTLLNLAPDKNLRNYGGGRPMPGHIRGRYTKSDSAWKRTDTVETPVGCILAQPGEYD